MSELEDLNLPRDSEGRLRILSLRAHLYRRQENFESANVLYSSIYRRYHRKLGPEHPSTIASASKVMSVTEARQGVFRIGGFHEFSDMRRKYSIPGNPGVLPLLRFVGQSLAKGPFGNAQMLANTRYSNTSF
jgi:hypothetical protein